MKRGDNEEFFKENERKLLQAANQIGSNVSGLATDLLSPVLDPHYLAKNWEALKVLKSEVFEAYKNRHISKGGLSDILDKINYIFEDIRRKRESERYKREKAFEENERGLEQAAERFYSAVNSFDPCSGTKSDLDSIKEYRAGFFEYLKKGVRKDKTISTMKTFEWAKQNFNSKMEQRKEYFEKKQEERERKQKEWEDRKKEKEKKQKEWEERQRERERNNREWKEERARKQAEYEARQKEREQKQREWEAEKARRQAEKERKQREWEAIQAERQRLREQKQREYEERQKERERKQREWEERQSERERRQREWESRRRR